ncbi:hypothetical protein SPBR_04423 [Sporothrix brasiliensis 5110]|uniref:Uncharacterized protein n=1 Tax=Sporothrix brasiliensis 5110 TaxID=1398154 RepID=A0A0C2F3M4_9PEZI|nr:uncharacterized protein SPBR_04423 [Sporothrix brasiliensis 5110]KIH93514.1 hypothetical protein SPBR_04423 [Sporothrix brasiliensis 5110]
MSAALQKAIVRAGPQSGSLAARSALCPSLRPAQLRPTARTVRTVPTALALRRASTYRNPNDSSLDDDDVRPPLAQQKYKNKKVWPPDFTRLSPQEQLRFEKRFKRRVALASARPRWVKFIKLAQLFSVTFVVIYCVLFMEWEYGPQPFAGVREWFWNTLGLMKGGGQNSAVRKADESARGNAVARK